MKPPRRPLFLDPDRYRRRRLMDAARLLPVLGAFLFFLPALWRPEASGHKTAIDGVYLFSVWAILIGIARLFAPGLATGSALADSPTLPGDASGLPSDVLPEPTADGKEGG
jgi:hypothetical protein